LTVLEWEAWALQHAIQVAIDKDWHRVIFESDSNTLVDCISSPTRGKSEFHALVSPIKSILVLHPNFEVKFVRRQTNMAAHTLARVACS
jgi:ribonuclease HI